MKQHFIASPCRVKPSTRASFTARSLVCQLLCWLLLGGAIPTGFAYSHEFATMHASLQAYPNAVVTLALPSEHLLFYVESNGRTLVALETNGRPRWSVDVIRFLPPASVLGSPVIRHLRLDGNDLWLTCGKNTQVKADIYSGRLSYEGGD